MDLDRDLDQRHHVELWAFAFLTFVVGDSLTTVLGLKRGAVESNPVGRGFWAKRACSGWSSR